VFSAPGFITYKGFKGVAYVGTSSGSIYALDYDLNRMFWTTKLTTMAGGGTTAACPGGLTSVAQVTPLPPAPALPGRGEVAGGRGGGPGGAGGGQGGGGGGFGGAGRGGVPGLYVVSSGGMLHNLNLQIGTDWFPPARLLPGSNAKVTGSIVVNSLLYVATAGDCGGVPNGVYAMDLTPKPPPASTPGDLPVVPDAQPMSTSVIRWETHGGSVVGSPAFTSDGTLYVSTGAGANTPAARSNAIVALDSKTLTERDYLLASTPFSTPPVTFGANGREFVAAGNADGRVYVLDAASLGGPDHQQPLATSVAASRQTITGLATFEDGGTRWILAAVQDISTPTPKHSVAAMSIAAQNGRVVVNPSGWILPLRSAPATPAIANGVAFVLATGRAQAAPIETTQGRTGGVAPGDAVLYAVDLATGRELWNSGAAIAAAAGTVGPAVDDGQVYVVASDGTLYTFGFVVER
jgi:outer membrane protein assembly factor BamB